MDDPKSNLKTESEKHVSKVGGLPMMDWWKQTASANPAAPEFQVIGRMITLAIHDTDDAHRKTAAVFANTLGMDDLAGRIPGLAQTRTIKADIAKGTKLSANKAMPPAYQAIDWTTVWKKGDVRTGAAIFKKRCIACHDSGQGGGVIGPSLAGVANRFTLQYLAQSVAAPSKDVSPNFQSWAIVQDNGKVLLGFLSGEDENPVTRHDREMASGRQPTEAAGRVPSLGDHGMWRMGDHSSPLHTYDETCHLPLIYRHPGKCGRARGPVTWFLITIYCRAC